MQYVVVVTTWEEEIEWSDIEFVCKMINERLEGLPLSTRPLSEVIAS